MQKASTLKRAILAGLFGVLAIGTLSSVPVEAVNSVPAFQIPVVGTTSSGGMFGGTATITGFTVNGQSVVANGTISGLVNGTQSIIATLSVPVTLPSTASAPAATQASNGCQVLNLMLGPINLNVLGLVVSIPNPVILNITAVPSATNSQSSLICDAANLLSGGGALQQVANDLNQLLQF